MQRHLDVHLIGHGQRTVDSRRRRAPVFVDFQANGTGGNLLAQRIGVGAIAFTQQADIDGKCIRRL